MPDHLTGTCGLARPAPVSEVPERSVRGKDGYHPFAWRGWWDFGTGALGDMACHAVNMPYMALNLRDPVSVQAETSGHNKDSFPSGRSSVRVRRPWATARP